MIFGLVMQAIFGFVLSGCYNLSVEREDLQSSAHILYRLVPGRIAGFTIMYGLFLAFGEVGPGSEYSVARDGSASNENH